jgi:uncharacterized protein YhhL (DUF1145 family)
MGAMSQSEYEKAFGVKPKNKYRVEKALEHALDIRKFEIELYWKRATYFWTLIASAFAAYFLVLNAEKMTDQKLVAFMIACIGFVFTFAWLQVNRGSKQWQENWENHVDMLEDPVTGPLFKTRLGRPDEGGDWFEKRVTGPSNISVSKTNQIVNLFTLVIWAFLGWNVLNPFSRDAHPSYVHIFLFALAVAACALILIKGRTHGDDYTHMAIKRDTIIGP